MRSELNYCTKSWCWIGTLLDKGYEHLWPLFGLESKPGSGQFKWSFYVRWKGKRGTHVNNVAVCEKHHKVLVKMYQDEMAGDVREQEVTERWLVANNSKMFS